MFLYGPKDVECERLDHGASGQKGDQEVCLGRTGGVLLLQLVRPGRNME